VLVVDDTPSGRAVLVDALSALGFEVHDAADGALALEEAARMRPDLVITDLVMPEMDGFELTRRLRSAPAGVHLPIIATSASATPDTEAQSRAAGANLFIGKPIERPALFGAIGSLLGLDWIHAAPPATTPVPAPADEAPSHLVAPPPDELELLRQLARIGNMRSIAERADHVRALDPRYAPFAARLQALAAGYQSKAILDLVEEAGRQGGDPQALGSPSPA
jgi:CheY-like chemotaxis protein